MNEIKYEMAKLKAEVKVTPSQKYHPNRSNKQKKTHC